MALTLPDGLVSATKFLESLPGDVEVHTVMVDPVKIMVYFSWSNVKQKLTLMRYNRSGSWIWALIGENRIRPGMLDETLDEMMARLSAPDYLSTIRS